MQVPLYKDFVSLCQERGGYPQEPARTERYKDFVSLCQERGGYPQEPARTERHVGKAFHPR